MALPILCGPLTEIRFTESTTWTVPPNVFSVNVECYGAGGAGGAGTDSDSQYPGGGGGGGAYGASNIPVSPGEVYTITIALIAGQTSDFNGPGGDVNAASGDDGGSGVGSNPGGAGGSGGGGDVSYSGGTGGDAGSSGTGLGGAGGGAAGPNGPGGTGGNAGGAAGTSGGGIGGNGGDAGISSAGGDGNFYGGGGGGGAQITPPGLPGGVGRRGAIILTMKSTYGLDGDFHQTHSTGQTNLSIQHCSSTSSYTTTKGIGFRRKLLLGALLGSYNPIPVPLPPFCGMTPAISGMLNVIGRLAPFQAETFISNGTFTVPGGIYSIYVECIAGGGGGGDGSSGGDENGGGGGGGGAYAASLISVLPGDAFVVNVGVGGSGEGFDGAATDFNSGQVLADFGTFGSGSVAGLGGLAVNCVGDTTISGGDGFTGISGASFPPAVGGATGGTGAGGGLGGIGGAPNTAGFPGVAPGGGGGGGGSTFGATGGATGADGYVRVTWVAYNFGFFGSPNHYPTARHQTHTTGQTNLSIPHCKPINQWTTTKGISVRNKAIAASLPPNPTPPSPPFCGRTTQASFNETTSWTVPTSVTEIYVECVAGGGGGGDGSSGGDENGGGGGGGSAYAASLVNVIPTTPYALQSGAGGTGDSVDGTATDFNSGQVLADFGVGATGSSSGTSGLASNSVGDTTFDGMDGSNGTTGSVPPVGGSTGGDATGGGTGGAGGAPNTAGFPGDFPGGGGGGGGSTFGATGGAAGADGSIKITWPRTYGLRGDIHQTHSTGQTNYSIMHCTPLNKYTTTKGIGMRRKNILGVSLSDLRVTQEYAEVFNVDPPNPNIVTTQFYLEIMDQPPPQTGFTANLYRRYTLIAAGLAEPNPPPTPFTAQHYLMWVYIGAALAAALEPEPTPPSPSPPCNCTCVTTCNICAGSGACPPPTVTYGRWSGMSP